MQSPSMLRFDKLPSKKTCTNFKCDKKASVRTLGLHYYVCKYVKGWMLAWSCFVLAWTASNTLSACQRVPRPPSILAQGPDATHTTAKLHVHTSPGEQINRHTGNSKMLTHHMCCLPSHASCMIKGTCL